MLHPLIALAAGAATVLAFAPFGIFVLGILGPAVLFWCWQTTPPNRGFILGFCFGLGLFGVGVSWVYVSMNVYGHMPMPLAAAAVAIFVMLLALFPAMVGWIFRSLCSTPLTNLLLTIPALWTLAEWVRSWFLSGFPWLSLGYSQVDSPLIGIAPWLGVYGISWAVTVLAGLCVAIVQGARQSTRLKSIIGLVCVLAIGWLGGLWQWAQPLGKPIRVALVQGNIALHEKWSPANRPLIVNNFLNLSDQDQTRDLIVWPESAIPYDISDLPTRFWDRLESNPADFVFGVIETQQQGLAPKTYNSVVSVSEVRQLYRKTHLVPFGEFLPLKPVLGWLIDYLNIPMADFDVWDDEQSRMKAAGINIGVSICYEDAFPDDVRNPLPDASVLINVSEDAWFGDSFAPHQRLDMARMRAVETRRPMLRAANTGVSAFIDHHGNVMQKSNQFVQTVVLGETQPMQGVTPFVRYGSWPIVVVCLAVLAVPGFIRRRRH